MTQGLSQRIGVLAAGILVVLAAAACSSNASVPASTSTVSTAGTTLGIGAPADVTSVPATPAPTATAAPVALNTDSYIELPLSDLSPDAAAYLETRDGPISVSVVVPERGAIYTWNGHEMLHMASVAKLGIMLTLMQQAIDAGRSLTGDELATLTPMITVSDNETASQLWDAIGGGEAIDAYMRSIGLDEVIGNKYASWGASYASSHDIALLLAKLARGEILDEQMRATALGLLSQVDPSQAWGVTAAAPEVLPGGTVIGVKDGWYPADCGWWVNSAGAILPSNGATAYTMAVLTAEQSTWEYGIETIETVGGYVHAALHGG